MSLALLQNATATSPGNTVPFSGIGGVPPYVYSVVPGGAGGSINSSTGLYTAPVVPTTPAGDTVKVVDAASAVATSQIAVGGVLQLVCDVIRNGLGLAPEQAYIYEQKILIPNDSRLYVAVGFLTCKPFSNIRPWTSGGGGVVANQSTNFSSALSVDIFSRGPAARDQKELVLLALNSVYAEQQQEANSFRIFPITNAFVNLTEQEGSAILYRFNLTVTVQYCVLNNQNVPYFDSFQVPEILTDA